MVSRKNAARQSARLSRILCTSAALAFVGLSGLQASPPGTVPFGVYDPEGAFSNDKGVAIEHLFLPWVDVYLQSLNDADDYAKERNRSLMVTLEPWTWTRDERNTPEILRKGIKDGTYDVNMRTICDILATLKSPVTLRWGHEMDDDNGQFIWAGWKPDDYIFAYRHVVDICRERAPNVRYLWSPLGDEGMEAYYPGDDYVDIVGVTVFGLQAWDQATVGHDQTFKEILQPRYERAVAFGKPVVVAELGYVGDSDYVQDWNNTVAQADPDFPALAGVVYFNQPEVYPWPNGFGLPDWRLPEGLTN